MDLKKHKASEYFDWISDLKSKIQSAQIKAALSVNKELLRLYWEIGKSISYKIEQSNWGTSVVEELSKDLKNEFPDQKGFSRTNLFSMKKWFEFYNSNFGDDVKVQQLVGQIPWGHNVVIISKSKSVDEAFFYCNKTFENNWSRSVLTHQIESELYQRKGKAITNFKTALPTIQSELAN